MELSPAQLAAFRRDGWLLVPGAFGEEQTRAARVAMERLYYGDRTFEEWLPVESSSASDTTTTHVPPELGQEEHRARFPVGVAALDDLVEHEPFLDIIEQCMGERAAFCDAHLFLRAGATDRRYPQNKHSGFHMDHNTNCWLPPAPGAAFGYINATAYLSDVTADCAPMLVCSGSHLAAAAITSNLTEPGQPWAASDSGDSATYPFVEDIREVPELSAPVPAVGPAGSCLVYSSYLFHAAQPFTNKRAQRVLWSWSCAPASTHPWQTLRSAWSPDERPAMTPFIQGTTPRVRSLFGWPEPGHAYYTVETLALLARLFPRMDLAPYYNALVDAPMPTSQTERRVSGGSKL